MIKIKRFYIVSADNVSEFETLLNTALNDGHLQHGQPFIFDGRICQTCAEVENQAIAPIQMGAR